MDLVQHEMKHPNRYTFDRAAEHVYNLLLKKDCYPRFIRSEHYKNLLANALQPSQKKRFFSFGATAKKKSVVATTAMAALPIQPSLKRRGSERSLSRSPPDAVVGHLASASLASSSASQSIAPPSGEECDTPYRLDPSPVHSFYSSIQIRQSFVQPQLPSATVFISVYFRGDIPCVHVTCSSHLPEK